MALKKKDTSSPVNKITPSKPAVKETAPVATAPAAAVVPEKKAAAVKKTASPKKETVKEEVKETAPVQTKAPAEKSDASDAPATGIKKDYLTTKNKCMVTFRLPSIAAPNAKCVCIVGEFNGWNMRANPMKKQKNGDYSITLELAPGRQYQYRYLIDESKWENDWRADKYVRSPLGNCDNSVVIT